MCHVNALAKVAYLGPQGTWTHQACLDIFGAHKILVPRDADLMFKEYDDGKINEFCIPVTTSLVGVTPYVDSLLQLKHPRIIAEYTKQLSYSLLGNKGSSLGSIKRVVGHPVALEEVKPWLDANLPDAVRIPVMDGAEKYVSDSGASDVAAFGPKIGTTIYGLKELAGHIEDNPNNVTRWWVLGDDSKIIKGANKTTFSVALQDSTFSDVLRALSDIKVRIIDIYERPAHQSLDSHIYIFDVDGYETEQNLSKIMPKNVKFKYFGSYKKSY